jgi:hypothetical protein
MQIFKKGGFIGNQIPIESGCFLITFVVKLIVVLSIHLKTSFIPYAK